MEGSKKLTDENASTSKHASARNLAIRQSNDALSGNYVFLKIETSGDTSNDEVIRIIVIDANENTLIDSLAKPKLKHIPKSATEIHGIDFGQLKTAPEWPAVWRELKNRIGVRKLVSYGVVRDVRLLKQTCQKWDIKYDLLGPHLCGQQIDENFSGNRRSNYSWRQSDENIETRDNLVATLKAIKRMATIEPVGGSVPTKTATPNQVALQHSPNSYKKSFVGFKTILLVSGLFIIALYLLRLFFIP